MNIESKLWKLESVNGIYVMVIQKASRACRMVSAGTLPSVNELAALNEASFNKVAREAFHDEAKPRR
jgi:hypothetical protein